MEVTQQHIDIADRLGACGERLEATKPGVSVFALPQEDLCWISDNMPIEAQAAAGRVDLALMARSGSGSVDGYGYGYGDGSGYGDGYGYGDGSGDGSGDGYGSGSGYVDGSGYG